MHLTSGPLGKVDQKPWKGLKCRAGEGWRRSFGPIVCEVKKCYRVKDERDILQIIKRRKANWIWLHPAYELLYETPY